MAKLKVKSIIISFLLSLAFCNIMIEVKSNEGIPITPNDEFFTEAIDFFDINPDTYRLVVTGAVANPLNLSFEDIRALPISSEIVRLTCIAYKYGARTLTGVANWTGVRLSYILNLAQINNFSAKDITFHTPDLSRLGYSTSLNLTEAFWGDVILAYEMNEEPLPAIHGFPIRLVCPRFYGYKWIKWLAYINVSSKNYEGFWENRGYEDSPYVDVNLPIYYSPIGTDITAFSSKSTQSTPWLGIEIILPLVITIGITRLAIKNRKQLS